MTAVYELLADHLLILLLAVIGIGSLLGRIRIGRIRLGAAAVLFVAIVVTALAGEDGVTLEILARADRLSPPSSATTRWHWASGWCSGC